jgi:protein-disulfide isomerase
MNGHKKPPSTTRVLFVVAITLLLFADTRQPAVFAVAGQSAVQQDEVSGLREELREMKKTLDEIKTLLQGAAKPQSPTRSTASVRVSGSPSLGQENAPVTLVEFSDFQCPFCKRHASTVYQALKKDYIDTGKLRYVFRDFPIASLHPDARQAHEAAHCAGEQNRFWDMHDRLFEISPDFSAASLSSAAAGIGLDAKTFGECVRSGRYAKHLDQEISEGTQAGVTGTPAFVIGPAANEEISGTVVSGAQPLERFTQIIDGVLAQSARGVASEAAKAGAHVESQGAQPFEFRIDPVPSAASR